MFLVFSISEDLKPAPSVCGARKLSARDGSGGLSAMPSSSRDSWSIEHIRREAGCGRGLGDLVFSLFFLASSSGRCVETGDIARRGENCASVLARQTSVPCEFPSELAIGLIDVRLFAFFLAGRRCPSKFYRWKTAKSLNAKNKEKK